MAIHNPLTGYEPNLLDNFDHSETSAAIFQDEYGDVDTEPSYSRDAELDDEIIHGGDISSSHCANLPVWLASSTTVATTVQCARAGLLGITGWALENVLARICQEADEPPPTSW